MQSFTYYLTRFYEPTRSNREDGRTAKALREELARKAWIPEDRQDCYLLVMDGMISDIEFEKVFLPEAILGLVFETEKQAELARDKYLPAFLHVFKE